MNKAGICLLCASDRSRVVSRLTGRELRTLFRALGHDVSVNAFGPVTPSCELYLYECSSCGFQFFDANLAGSGSFYEELGTNYYPSARPEFVYALEKFSMAGARRVLDIGGGSGAFLDLARAKGHETLGLELSAEAAAEACRKGHKVLNESLETVDAASFGGPVDAITLFQVVEHLPNPRTFLATALNLLRPGGLLVASVPNRYGLRRIAPLDPMNLPPHHISRWRIEDLRRLGEACGLRCVDTSGDILFGRQIADFWHLQNRLAIAIGNPPIPGGRWLPELITLAYRKLGLKFIAPRSGLSIYATYQKD